MRYRYVSTQPIAIMLLPALILASVAPNLALAQEAIPAQLNIVVVEGEGALNNIRQRVVRETIVKVEDENHKPIAGVALTFTLPNQGASGVFANGSRTFTVLSDPNGQAIARFTPNKVTGQLEMRVNASHQGRTASTKITQSNALVGAVAGTAVSLKLIAILAAVGAGAIAGGVYAATRDNGSNSATPATGPIAVTPGSPVVGPPR